MFLAALEIHEVSADTGETFPELDAQPSAAGSLELPKASG